MSSRHEIIGTYQGLKSASCSWPNDDGSETIIGRIESGSFDKGDYVSTLIKGRIFPGDLVRNLTYRFYGNMKSHEKYGDQFAFESFTLEVPMGEEAISAYLTQCRGIGPVMARTIFKEFGEDSVRALRETPEVVREKVPRLSIENALEASKFLQLSEQTERTKMSVFGLLKGRGFPKKAVDSAITKFGAKAASIIARNPYRMMEFSGCGFAKTDKMYLDLGMNPSKMKRQALCAWYAVSKSGSGDTWVRFFEVKNFLKEQIASATVDVERAMTLAVKAKLLSQKFHAGQRWVAEYAKDRQEQRIAMLVHQSIEEAKSVPVLWEDIADELEGINDHQKEHAKLATSGFIGILAGRPGSGKTHTSARIVKLLQKKFGTQHVAVAAPTGKAAVRVTSAMNEAGVHINATTLHSLLKYRGDKGFEHGAGCPLPHKFVVVDEASMIDTPMMRVLLESRAEGAHILFIGDVNQLAPVGHGAPLRDFIFANMAHGELREIQRNSGRIVKACSDIIDLSRLVTSTKLDLAAGENLLLIERQPEDQVDTLVQVMQKYQRDWLQNKEGAFDPIWDIQVIVAVNAKSDLGRKPLNAKLQDLLNPDGYRVPGNPFRIADKIINTKNSEYKSINDGKNYVANGEQAEVLDVIATQITARLTNPDRTIVIPRSAKSVNSEGESAPASDDSEEASGTGCNWELAYAISGHKSQGSEWPIAIVMIDDYNGAKMVQSKQWIFTSISRSKKIGVLIGKQKTANECCSRDALFKRKTFLKERIIDAMNQIPMTRNVIELLTKGVS